MEIVIFVILLMVIWVAYAIYKHNTSHKLLIKAMREVLYFEKSKKVEVKRKYEILEKLITLMTKQYIITNDGIEFVMEKSGITYFLETGVEDNFIPKLSVVKSLD